MTKRAQHQDREPYFAHFFPSGTEPRLAATDEALLRKHLRIGADQRFAVSMITKEGGKATITLRLVG